MAKKKPSAPPAKLAVIDYGDLVGDLVSLLEMARRASVRAVNAVISATYWEIGCLIVESEQRGEGRADYGQKLLKKLAADLTTRFGRGFSDRSLYKMRLFFLSHQNISPTLSAKSTVQLSPTLSAKSSGQDSSPPNMAIQELARSFPLPQPER